MKFLLMINVQKTWVYGYKHTFSNQIIFPNYMLNIGQKRYLKKKYYDGRRLARHVDFLLIFYSLSEPVVEKFWS